MEIAAYMVSSLQFKGPAASLNCFCTCTKRRPEQSSCGKQHPSFIARFQVTHVQTYDVPTWTGSWQWANRISSISSMPMPCIVYAGKDTLEAGNVGSSFLPAGDKVGVLLLNLGGPERLEDVEPFLFNLFADPDIIRLPWFIRFLQSPLAKLISTTRAPKSKEAYASIGGGSPLCKITNEQAEAIEAALRSKGVHANVYVGMRYWHPFIKEAVEEVKEDKIEKLIVLPLYPHFSISTTGSSLRVLENNFRNDRSLSYLRVATIKSWYQRQGYIKSMSDLIEQELEKFPDLSKVMLFFSAHGVPLSYVEKAGDPYKSEIEHCVSLIIGELRSRGRNNGHALAFQSRVGPVQWLKPYTDEAIVDIAKKGVKSLLVIPISFISEHIETLEEIDMQYKQLALESGISNWGRVPALNCLPSFMEDLADAIIEALPHAKTW